MIVAQNWGQSKLKLINANNKTILYKYKNRLGINGARQKLRKHFLESEYDYLIMLDDDSTLFGTKEDGLRYIEDIKNHPNMWGAKKPLLLKLFAISKEVFKEVDYKAGSIENGDFFEDMLLIRTLEKRYPERRFYFNASGLREQSDSVNDPLSTWYHGQFVKREIGDRTREIIKEL